MKLTLVKNVKSPTRATPKSAGLDFYVPNDFGNDVWLYSKSNINIASGVKCEVPKGYALIAFNKSGRALEGLQVGACVIDEDYQGEIHLHVYNTTTHEIQIKPGQKLVQFILLPVLYEPVEIVYEFQMFLNSTSKRKEGGFGSTGL